MILNYVYDTMQRGNQISHINFLKTTLMLLIHKCGPHSGQTLVISGVGVLVCSTSGRSPSDSVPGTAFPFFCTTENIPALDKSAEGV